MCKDNLRFKKQHKPSVHYLKLKSSVEVEAGNISKTEVRKYKETHRGKQSASNLKVTLFNQHKRLRAGQEGHV